MIQGFFTEEVGTILRNKHFKYTVDLGCGVGRWASIIKAHTDYLIGVDIDPHRVILAKDTGFYNETIAEDVRYYKIPIQTDSLIMIEVIEHLKKDDGFDILEKTQLIPFMLITTPVTFQQPLKPFSPIGHKSLWAKEDFEAFGFKTRMALQYPLEVGGHLIAYRDLLIRR